jgi:hypothetical protein
MTPYDQILALQFTIAWAGEGRSQPKRLGWWDTDLVDEAGGGDFFARLAPRTHAWASLEAVREAARRVDEKARKKMADPDAMRTLFFLGFDIDEQLADHLAALKREGRTPADALSLPNNLAASFSKEALVAALTAQGNEPTTVVPGGPTTPWPRTRRTRGARAASRRGPRAAHGQLPAPLLQGVPMMELAMSEVPLEKATIAELPSEVIAVHARLLRLALGVEGRARIGNTSTPRFLWRIGRCSLLRSAGSEQKASNGFASSSPTSRNATTPSPRGSPFFGDGERWTRRRAKLLATFIFSSQIRSIAHSQARSSWSGGRCVSLASTET